MEAARVFAERLKDLREKNGISQGKLADEIGISRGALSYYENEQRTADIHILSKIAAYFNVTTDYLLGLKDYSVTDIEAQNVCEYTGLTEDAVSFLHDVATASHPVNRNYMTITSLVLSDTNIMNNIQFYIDNMFHPEIIEKVMIDMGRVNNESIDIVSGEDSPVSHVKASSHFIQDMILSTSTSAIGEELKKLYSIISIEKGGKNNGEN